MLKRMFKQPRLGLGQHYFIFEDGEIYCLNRWQHYLDVCLNSFSAGSSLILKCLNLYSNEACRTGHCPNKGRPVPDTLCFSLNSFLHMSSYYCSKVKPIMPSFS